MATEIATNTAIGPFKLAELHLSVSQASQEVNDGSLQCSAAISGVEAQNRFTDG